MVKDLGDKVTEIQTDKGIVFSIEALGSPEENWTYFANGEIRKTYGTYVTPNFGEPIRQLYLNFRDSTSNKGSNDYRDKLSRLIRVGRSAGHHGENGYAFILVYKNKEYDLILHKIVGRSIISIKKETPKHVEKSPQVPTKSEPKKPDNKTSDSKITLLGDPVPPSAKEHYSHSSMRYVAGKPK